MKIQEWKSKIFEYDFGIIRNKPTPRAPSPFAARGGDQNFFQRRAILPAQSFWTPDTYGLKEPGMNIQEFAATLGLSVSTVSKALNGREDVSPSTRRRVLEAAEHNGFSPDPTARRLRRQSTDTVAFVISAPQTSFAHPFFLDMLVGVTDAMDAGGYQVIIASARSVETELDVFKRLISRQRIDALLFGRTRRHDERIAYLLEHDVPFVAFGRSETSDDYAYVDIDRFVVGRSGCARFIALGHRRIGLVHTPDYLMLSHFEREGYKEALRAAGLPFDETLCVEAAMSEEDGVRAARGLLELPDPPTAIVCGHDFIAMGVKGAAFKNISLAIKIAVAHYGYDEAIGVLFINEG